MKKLLALCTFVFLLNFFSNAQKEFPMQWKMSFPVSPDYKLINADRSLVLEGDMTEFAMIDAVAGKVLWKAEFKEKYGTKKSKSWEWDRKKNVIIITFKGESKKEEKLVYVDGNTGNMIDENTFKTTKEIKEVVVKSNMKWRNSYYIADKDITLDLQFEKSLWIGSSDSKKKRAISVVCSGGKSWVQTVQGNYVRDLCTGFGESFGGPNEGIYLDITVHGDKVFVIYEGISVLDLNTGKLLWETTFDNSDYSFGLFKSTQTLGRAAMPLASENGVYIADLSDKNFKIKKYDINNGTLLWSSEKFDNDDVVPQLEQVGNVLLARFGGTLEVQEYHPGSSSTPARCVTQPKMVGNKGVKAYDANTGKLLWETFKNKELGDKFGSSITNFLTDEKNIYISSDKNVFALDLTTGKPKFAVPVKKLKIDNPNNIDFLKDNIIIEANEGIASISKTDGKVNFATNTDKCLGTFWVGDAYFVWTGKDVFQHRKFVRLDTETGNLFGKLDDTPHPYFTPDGNSFIKFDGGKMYRFKTKL
jgi:hypothetical protein